MSGRVLHAGEPPALSKRSPIWFSPRTPDADGFWEVARRQEQTPAHLHKHDIQRGLTSVRCAVARPRRAGAESRRPDRIHPRLCCVGKR